MCCSRDLTDYGIWGTIILYYQNIVFSILLWNASKLLSTFQWLGTGIMRLSLTVYYLSFKHNLCFFLCSNAIFCFFLHSKANFCFFLHAANIRCLAACLRWWAEVPHLKVGTILMVAGQPAEHPLLLLSAAVPLDFMTGTILTILDASCRYLWLFTNTFLDFRNGFRQ
jgi:hypothetical protein